MLELLSSTAGVKGLFFIVTIVLMRYNFVLIFFLFSNNVGEALYSFLLSFPFMSHPHNKCTLQ